MTPTVVLNVVGMTPGLMVHAPHLQTPARAGALRPLSIVLPAVTTTVQTRKPQFPRQGLESSR